ncbi:MAG: SBBP repeat-containing protein [Myxococcota bacterium]|nr:SBBP repeat-containing protein [Myxococcota bacterium]
MGCDGAGELLLRSLFAALLVAGCGRINFGVTASNTEIDALVPQPGTVLGVATCGGVGVSCRVRETCAHPSGELTVVGSLAGTGSATFGAHLVEVSGTGGVFVARLDQAGDPRWVRTFDNRGAVANEAFECTALSDDVVVVGRFHTMIDFGLGSVTANGSNDGFVTRIDSAGTTRWARGVGSTGADAATAVTANATGDVVVIAAHSAAFTMDGVTLAHAGSVDVATLAFDAATGVVKTGWSAGTVGYEEIHGAAGDPRGRFHVVGHAQGGGLDLGAGPMVGAGGYDLVIGSFADPMTHRWSRLIGGPGDEYGAAIAVDRQDRLYIVGTAQDQVDFGTGPLPASGPSDGFVASLADDGATSWATLLGGAGEDAVNAVLVHADTLYVAGLFTGTLTHGAITLDASDAVDAFVLAMDLDGTPRWAHGFGGAGTDRAVALAVTGGGELVVGVSLDGDLVVSGQVISATATDFAWVRFAP